jgi:hypothetical protein
MNGISIILTVVAISIFVFSAWSFILLRKHLRQFKGNYKHSSSLTDEKYFELKSKQEYIIAVSTVIFALFSFIGYSSIDNIKKDIKAQVEEEMKKVAALRDSANQNLDSARSGLEIVNLLKNRVKQISSKDVIKQDIFIVDPLKIGDFPEVKQGFRLIKFKDLTTISGQKLPIFKVPPSLMCFSNSSRNIFITDITTESFKINPIRTVYLATEDSDAEPNIKDNKISLWISSKKNAREFSDDFNDDFK